MKKRNYFDENLKKLFRLTKSTESVPENIKEQIFNKLPEDIVMENKNKTLFQSFNFKATVIAAAAAVLVVCLVYLLMPQSDTDNLVKIPEIRNIDVPQAIETAEFSPLDVEKFAAAGDIKNLMAVLDKGSMENKVAAANFLAKIGATEAAEQIKKAADQWQGSGENPFKAAVEKIQTAQNNNHPAVMIKEVNEPNKLKSSAGAIKAAEPNAPKDPNDPNNWPFVEIWVVDKQTDEPIKEVEVKGSADKKKAITDSEGYCKVTLGKKKSNYFSVSVRKAGFVPVYFTWGSEVDRAIPEDYTFFLDKGTVIGGTVKNDSNEPIRDANVVISMYSQSQNSGSTVPFVQVSDYVVQTDAEGKWLCDIIPAELSDDQQVNVTVQKEGYTLNNFWATADESSKLLCLRNRSLVITLSRGAIIYGYVRDSRNNPVAGASILLGDSSYSNDAQKIKTDENGYYEFQNANQGYNVITVQSKGFAPNMRELNSTELSQQADFVLTAGIPISGYVVDVNGNPVEKAEIRVQQWQYRQTLNWKIKTDASGKFIRKHIPSGNIECYIYKKGYMDAGLVIDADKQQEYRIVLYPPLTISGNIIDGDTNQPITNCKISTGTVWRNNEQVYWQTGSSSWVKTFTTSQYKMTPRSTATAYVLRADVNDGRYALSRRFDPNEGDVKYDFIIGGTQQNTIAGVIYLPDGKPAEAVKIYMIKKGQWGQFKNGKSPYWNEQQMDKTVSDAQGRFNFPEYKEFFKLVAICDSGFADVNSTEFFQKPEMHLRQWGRIEGVVYTGSNPAANKEMYVYSMNTQNNSDGANYQYSNSAMTDEQGKFTIEKAVPGRNQIGKSEASGYSRSYTTREQIDVISGQTTQVVIGGKGRTVVGTIIWPSQEFYQKSLEISGNVQSRNPSVTRQVMEIYSKIDVPLPDDFDSLTAKQSVEWYQKWMQSDQGKAWQAKVQEELVKAGVDMAKNSRNVSIVVDSAGGFKAEEIEQGSYKISVQVLERTGRYGQADYQNPLLQGTFDFDMPAIDETNLDVPLDLGQVSLNITAAKASRQSGENAPEFSIETNAGTVKSSDLLGKYVVLVSWECFFVLSSEQAEVSFDTILDVYKKYSGSGNVEFIGISYKHHKIAQTIAEKYLREKQCDWKQSFIKFDEPVWTNLFPVMGNSQMVIIRPDGKIAAFAKTGSELAEILAEQVPAQ